MRNTNRIGMTSPETDDCCSEILAGNIFKQAEKVCDESGDEFSEFDSDEFENVNDSLDLDCLTIEDIEIADKLFEEQLGVKLMIRSLIKLVISKKMLPTDILLQALGYTIQSHLRGKQSVRYLESYGMYWSGVRNLLKTRGLLSLREHFPIPSDLGKFKKKILDTCGLQKQSLGKSGIQERNVDLWIKAKKEEANGKKIGLSIAIDGKKIAASSTGLEDLAG